MNKRMKLIFICFTAVALVLVIASSFFVVQSVDVQLVSVYEDMTVLDADVIGQASGVLGKNILTLNERTVINGIHTSYPRVKVIAIERFFPSSVTIYVTERVALFAVETEGGYALIDREAMVLDNVVEAGDVPIARGISVLSSVPGRRLIAQSGEVEKLLEVVAAFEGMEYVGRNFCTTVDYVDLTTTESCKLLMDAGVCFEFNDSANVYYQVLSFMNWYGVSPAYRYGGTAKVDNVFDAETQRFGIIYTPEG